MVSWVVLNFILNIYINASQLSYSFVNKNDYLQQYQGLLKQIHEPMT